MKSAKDWFFWRRLPESWLLRVYQQLDHAAQDPLQAGMGMDVDQGRDIGVVDLINASFGLDDPHAPQDDGPFQIFAFGEYLKVFARDLHGPLAGSTVLIAHHLHLGQKTCADSAVAREMFMPP